MTRRILLNRTATLLAFAAIASKRFIFWNETKYLIFSLFQAWPQISFMVACKLKKMNRRWSKTVTLFYRPEMENFSKSYTWKQPCRTFALQAKTKKDFYDLKKYSPPLAASLGLLEKYIWILGSVIKSRVVRKISYLCQLKWIDKIYTHSNHTHCFMRMAKNL